MKLKLVGKIRRESPRRRAVRLKRLFKLLSVIENTPDLSQRIIADELNVSIGTTNYLLQEASEKGWINMEPLNTAESFDSEQQGYKYSLTKKGLEKKRSMTEKFLSLKMDEYRNVKEEIQEIKSLSQD